MMNFLFGGALPAPAQPPKSTSEVLKEQLKGWQKNLRKEMMRVDRSVREGKQSEAKLVAEVKMLLSKNQVDNAKRMTHNLCRMRSHIQRQVGTHAMLNSLSMQLGEQAAVIAVAGTLGKASDILKTMNDVMKNGECQAIIKSLEHEMITAGVLEEELNEGIDSALPSVNEEEVDTEVDATLFALSNGALGKAPAEIEAAKQREVVKRQEVLATMMAAGGGGGP